jgi:hypothetical protein
MKLHDATTTNQDLQREICQDYKRTPRIIGANKIASQQLTRARAGGTTWPKYQIT